MRPGYLISKLMEEDKVDEYELAKRLHWSAYYLKHVLSGRGTWVEEDYRRIFDALGRNLDDFERTYETGLNFHMKFVLDIRHKDCPEVQLELPLNFD